MDILIFISNLCGALAAGLWGLKYFLLRDLKMEGRMSSSVTDTKLKFSSFAKYFLFLFILLKIVIIIIVI